MSNERFGTAGTYFGSYFNESESLSQSEMEANAYYIYEWLVSVAGWSLNAVAGLLGNIQAESSINPGRWQSDNVGNMSGGYGLVQWTPASNFIDWCYSYFGNDSDPSIIDWQLNRLIYELNNNLQYYSTTDYNLSFPEFSTSSESPYYLACAFAWNYERSYTVLYGTEEEKEALRRLRGGYAEAWYTYLSGSEPPGPIDPPNPDPVDPTKLNKKRYKFLLFTARKRLSR